MNNVNSGDLAFVARHSKTNPQTLGLLVRVLQQDEPCEFMPGVRWHIRAESERLRKYAAKLGKARARSKA